MPTDSGLVGACVRATPWDVLGAPSSSPSRSWVLFSSLGLLLAIAPPSAEAKGASDCPSDMVSVDGRFCIDRWEASLDRIDERGKVIGRQSPYLPPVPGTRWIARSRPGVIPQAHISQEQASVACAEAGKRLCSDEEWIKACRGRNSTQYPYGNAEEKGRCNDRGVSPLRVLHGKDDSVFGIGPMNDPRLNQVPGSLARTGSFSRCRGSYGNFDMVGNLHEWTAATQGTFRGGYYLDTHINGDGCGYQTTAHVPSYFDYSIGFRCCRDPGPRRSRGGSRSESQGKMSPDRDAAAIHSVAKGETLGDIAKRYHVALKALCGLNGIGQNFPIKVGQRLKIPSIR